VPHDAVLGVSARRTMMGERAVLVGAARRAVEDQAARLAVLGVVFHLCFYPIRGDKHLNDVITIVNAGATAKTKICDTPRARGNDAQPPIVTMLCCPGAFTCRMHPIQ
jgi:hypothetical protein